MPTKKYAFVISILPLIFLMLSCGINFPTSKLTLIVVDEEGKPVESAKVSFGFIPGKDKDVSVKGVTDKHGMITASHKSIESVAFNINKDGYYYSGGGYRFESNTNGKWQPWNPEIKVILRKIINPVPMYTRTTQMSKMDIPVIGKAVGFDLVEYDWVKPYGRGRYSDFIFKLNRSYTNDHQFDCKLQLNFSDRYDGIQEVSNDFRHSDFILPRVAPESGYIKAVTKWRTYDENSFNDTKNYIFRVRSESVNGKLIRAMYGKIHGDIRFDPRGTKTASIIFDYYVNPDYTSNLEYDPKQNLFKNIQSYEGLKRP